MARRRSKKRTHVGANPENAKTPTANSSATRIPKSMVIRMGAGDVGSSVSQLAKDVRYMMEPHTASRLKERRSNRLRDYTTMAGPLGVSHLLLFSRSEAGNVNLRLALTPRGPTLHFRVEKYSLCKDVKRAMKHPKGSGKEFINPPLLVMNNFMSPASASADQPGSEQAVPKHLESLTTTIFQSLFPAIFPQSTPLTSIQRVLLLNRETPSKSNTSSPADEASYVLNLRHYAITTKRTGLPRSLRRINAAEKLLNQSRGRNTGLPNLGKLEDVADYILDPSGAAGGFTSGSESEVETDAEVEVLETTARKVLSAKKMQAKRAEAATDANKTGTERSNVEKRAVKLVELGPRLKLRMTKVEEGVCGGKVMWHEFVNKSPEEIKKMEKAWEVRKKEKDERKRVQKENVERKRKERGAGKKREENVDGGDEIEEDEWDSEDYEDMVDEDGEEIEADDDEVMEVQAGLMRGE